MLHRLIFILMRTEVIIDSLWAILFGLYETRSNGCGDRWIIMLQYSINFNWDTKEFVCECMLTKLLFTDEKGYLADGCFHSGAQTPLFVGALFVYYI